MNSKRKIGVVTGTRADYGLLKHLIKALAISPEFQLQLLVTGSHLSKRFGLTCTEIENDGFCIDRKIDINTDGDLPSDIANSTGLSITGMSRAYAELKPDLVILLGDRYEILGAAIAAMINHVPIAHLHGGEVTLGAMDEGIRHAITKFSHLHFVAANEYRNRVIQLGENPEYVFTVGGLGVDAICRVALLSRTQLEQNMGIKFKNKNLLITLHSVTLEMATSAEMMRQLLRCLAQKTDTLLIFTMPNADTDNRVLFQMIEDFVSTHENACCFTSLGQLNYFSCLSQVDAVIGNSSSGIAEAPTFKKATVNIGDRQNGRIRASSIIDCRPDCDEIARAIDRIYEADFQETLKSTVNPYGRGGAVEKIMTKLKSTSFDGLLKKKFYDLPVYNGAKHCSDDQTG